MVAWLDDEITASGEGRGWWWRGGGRQADRRRQSRISLHKDSDFKPVL